MIKLTINQLHSLGLSLLLLLASFVFDACATNPVTGQRELMLMSAEQEKAMGQQTDPAIVAEFGLYPDEQLQQFINAEGQKMVKVSHMPNLPFTFRVLDSPVVNAFALPGGYVYFTRGILAHFNNEAQFAGVLGHEIGHVTARHSAKQYSRTMLAQLGLIAGMVVSPTIAQYGELAMQGMQLLLLKYGRDAETQSDELGVEYSTKIGYDAHEMADFFNTLDRLSGGSDQRLPAFLSTHPDPANREVRVEQLATEWQQQFNATGQYEVGRDSYLRMIDGIIYGEDPRQGFVENNVFYHPELKFQFPVPSQWQYANSPQQFQMAPTDGKALMSLMLAQGNSLEQAAQNAMQQFQLQVVSSREQRVNGLPALEVIADQVQQEQSASGQAAGQAIRTLSYFIQYGGNIYHIIGMSLAQDFDAYSRYFLSTMTNFRQLTDSNKLNRQPDRIRVREVPSNMTLQSALQQFGTPADKLQEMAVVNGMELSTQLQRGTLIKTLDRG